MKHSLMVVLVFCATCIAQQPGAPPPHGAPTPPPPPRQDRPGDEPQAPKADQAPTTEEVQAQIQHKLASEPALMGTGVKATVDDKTVVLTGAVENDYQHELALRIAASYAGDREIVDDIETLAKI